MNTVSRWTVGVLLAATAAGCSTPRVSSEPSPRYAGEAVCEFSRAEKPEGLSGITRLGGNRYWCVDDRGGRLYEMEISVGGDGSVEACRQVRCVSLSGRRDLEGCARDPLDGCVWVSDESDTSVRQFDPSTGEETARAEIPDVFRQNVVANRSLEALAISPDGRKMYVANEDTLKCDGPLANNKHGGSVRILELTRKDGSSPWRAARQFRYETEAIAGDAYKGLEISGVVALAVSESGALYVLEREMSQKNPLFPTFRACIYEVWPRGEDGAVLPKLLVWTEDTAFANYEGFCFGPSLGDGTPTMVLVSDGGGPAVETVCIVALRKVDPNSRRSP